MQEHTFAQSDEITNIRFTYRNVFGILVEGNSPISEEEGKYLPTTWQATCGVACRYIIILGGIANGKGDCWSKLGR